MDLTYQKVLESCQNDRGAADEICKILNVPAPNYPDFTPEFKKLFTEIKELDDMPTLGTIFVQIGLIKKLSKMAKTEDELYYVLDAGKKVMPDEVVADLVQKIADLAQDFDSLVSIYLIATRTKTPKATVDSLWQKMVKTGTVENWRTTSKEYETVIDQDTNEKFFNQFAQAIKAEAEKQ